MVRLSERLWTAYGEHALLINQCNRMCSSLNLYLQGFQDLGEERPQTALVRAVL